MEAPGIDPGTSRMLSERSTIWATPPDVWEGQLNSLFIFELNAFPLSLTEFTGFGQDRKARGETGDYWLYRGRKPVHSSKLQSNLESSYQNYG